MVGRAASRRQRAVIIAAAILLALGGVLLWARIWAEPVMNVTITVLPDGEEAVEVHYSSTPLAGDAGSWPVLERQIDLRRWEGKLVRVDVKGRVRPTRFVPIRLGYVACSAKLSEPGSTRPVRFVGWLNEGPPELHLGALGCRTRVPQSARDPSFVYAKRGTLWRVLRVPPRAVLHLALLPIGDGEAASAPVVSREQMQRQNLAGTSVSAPEPLPDIFIYLIDTVRADHVSACGYLRKTTPVMEKFASAATVYENAQTASTWTRPSVATLLTGLYPFVHGAMHRTTDRLGEWPVLLPEILKEAGYQTAGIVTNTAVNGKFGFNQGYDRFRYRYKRPADWVNREAETFLKESDPARPVFMYLHTMEPHSPYTPRPESLRLFDRGFGGRCDGSRESLSALGCVRPKVSSDDIEHLVDLYDAELFDADRGFGQFLRVIEKADRFDNALIILVADHGEAFNEHRTLEHGNSLNQEEMHVPLVVRYPGGQFSGMRIPQRVSLIDVFRTVLAVAGIDADLGYQVAGHDLRPGGPSAAHFAERSIFAEVSRDADNHLDLVGVIDRDGYKLVIDSSTPKGFRATKELIGLWNTGKDVVEAVDIESSHPVRASYCEQLIVEWLNAQQELRKRLAPESVPRLELSDEVERELRGLGYID